MWIVTKCRDFKGILRVFYIRIFFIIFIWIFGEYWINMIYLLIFYEEEVEKKRGNSKGKGNEE